MRKILQLDTEKDRDQRHAPLYSTYSSIREWLEGHACEFERERYSNEREVRESRRGSVRVGEVAELSATQGYTSALDTRLAQLRCAVNICIS